MRSRNQRFQSTRIIAFLEELLCDLDRRPLEIRHHCGQTAHFLFFQFPIHTLPNSKQSDVIHKRIRSTFWNISKMRHDQRASTRSIAQFGEETHRVELLHLDLQATLLRNGENLAICFDEKRFGFAITRLDLRCVAFDNVQLHGEERRFDRTIRIRWKIVRIRWKIV